jgi:hypothetical protein
MTAKERARGTHHWIPMLDFYGRRTRHYEKGLIVAIHPFGDRIKPVSQSRRSPRCKHESRD